MPQVNRIINRAGMVIPLAGVLLAYTGMAAGADPSPLVRPYRPPLPPVGTIVEFEDLDGDGDPDVLRSVAANGTPLQWIDDDDDMKPTDLAGDADSDCLMVDRNRDGAYGGPQDIMIDWNDNDRDGRADMQVVAENAKLTDTGWGPGHYMIVVDTDRDGVFNYLDWTDFTLRCWEHSGASRFLEDYLGTSLFLKMHTATANIRDLRYNWENPFLFYDPDGDGLCEKAIRLCDSPQIHKPPSEGFSLPADGNSIPDEHRRVEFTRKIDWASIAQDLDNDSVPGNEFDFDMTLHFHGPGFGYEDQVHEFPAMRGLPESDRFFYDPRWRQITELIYPDHDAAYDLVLNRGQWNRCWLVFDEDDDCHRWERVELYEPRDPFKIGVRKGGSDQHPQADCSGDRGEWDNDYSGGGKLYVGRFDGRIHLYGAEWACWRIDQAARYFQGWSRSKEQPDRFPTIRYSDTDGNGFLDQIEFDLDGDTSFERVVSLPLVGVDDTCEVIDPRTMKYEDFTALFRRVAENLWTQAEAAGAVAKANGVDLAHYALLRRPGSLQEKYHFGYWLTHYIYADLVDLAVRSGDVEFMSQLDAAHFGGDWSRVQKRLAEPTDAATPSVRVEVTNPIDLARASETIEIPWTAVVAALPGATGEGVRAVDAQSGRELVSQAIDVDGNGELDALLFQADFSPSQTRAFVVQAASPTLHRSAPSPVHAKFVPTRMDDMAWESDRIAFRVYGPALRVETISNGIDVWCKRVQYSIVEKWYRPGVDYHTDHGEGADFFKVGPTLGCGGTGIWKDGKLYRGENFARWQILANGPIRTLFVLEYDALDCGGVQVTETKRFSLDAGHNLTRIESNFTYEPADGDLQVAAGLVKRPGVQVKSTDAQPWIAMWGPLEPEGNGELGTAVVMDATAFRETADAAEHVLAIGAVRPGRPLVHYAGAGWTKSGDFASADEWNAYVEHWARRLNAPLKIQVGQ